MYSPTVGRFMQTDPICSLLSTIVSQPLPRLSYRSLSPTDGYQRAAAALRQTGVRSFFEDEPRGTIPR